MTTERILVIKLGAFGDVIMCEGLMRCIRAHHANAHITLLTDASYGNFMARAPHFDAIITDPRQPRWKLHALYALRRTLKAQPFDRVYDLQNSARTKLYAKWLKPARICSKFGNADYAYDLKTALRATPDKSVRDHLAAQIARAGVDVSGDILPNIAWAGAPAAEITTILRAANIASGFVLLICGSSARNRHRRWAHYKTLAEQLIAAGIQPITAPGPDEMEMCRALPAQILLADGKPLNFHQLIALAPHTRFVVGNDTGPTHLMAAARTKGLALFGKPGSAAHTGIAQFYDVLEVADLNTLAPARVCRHVLDAIGN